MSYEFAKKEIGDYRITIYQDEDAESPCSAWDLAGVYLWEYTSCGSGRLSNGCNWDEIYDRKYAQTTTACRMLSVSLYTSMFRRIVL